jgi:hypothetical protein
MIFVILTVGIAAAAVLGFLIGRLDRSGGHDAPEGDSAPERAPGQPHADWVVARFRDDWERVRREGVPLPPLRDCCVATVDEQHTAACEDGAPASAAAPRHAAVMPRRRPIAGRQPWQTAQNPALRDQAVVPAYAPPVYGDYPCCVHCGDELDHLIHTKPCDDGCNGTAPPVYGEAPQLVVEPGLAKAMTP